MEAADPTVFESERAFLVGCALIACLIAGLYAPVLDGYLWHDDFAWLAGAQRFDLSTTFGIAHRNHFYRPAIDLYFGLMMALFGYSPRVFHALNVLLHIVNAWLVFALGRRVLASTALGWSAAMIFAVLPGFISAIAWVSAATALVMAACYATALLAHVTWLAGRSPVARATAMGAFVAALLSHEGAVSLLPTMWLADRLGVGVPVGSRRAPARTYLPFAIALVAYLAISFLINRANYLVVEHRYDVGWHAVGNALEYITTLYVGRHGLVSSGAAVGVLAAVFLYGTNRARFAAGWMLMALLPYCFFVAPGTTGRYMYVAAMGFSMLAAELIGRLAVRAGAWAGPRLAVLAAGVLVIAAAARFASFTAHTTPSAAEAGRPYRAWLESFRASHPTLPRGGSIDVDDPKQAAIDSRSLQPMLQLEYGDPDLRVQVRSR